MIDKGTLDAVICDPDKVVSEVDRVLSKNGMFVCITFGMPENRMDYLQKPTLHWKVTHISIRNLSFLY